jgi:hypothetical protein
MAPPQPALGHQLGLRRPCQTTTANERSPLTTWGKFDCPPTLQKHTLRTIAIRGEKRTASGHAGRTARVPPLSLTVISLHALTRQLPFSVPSTLHNLCNSVLANWRPGVVLIEQLGLFSKRLAAVLRYGSVRSR